MSISIQKGQKSDITKTNPGLQKIVVGLGWDTKKYSGSFDFDLDASAFVLNDKGKVAKDQDFIFYNNPIWGNNGVVHSGDNRIGGDSGDAEQITVDFGKIDPSVSKIAFTCTIHEAESRKQNFGQISNAYIRIFNPLTNEEILRYNLGEDYSVETAIVFGEVYRYNNEWKFNAIGSGFKGGLAALCNNFGVVIDDATQQEMKNNNMNSSQNNLKEQLNTEIVNRADITNLSSNSNQVNLNRNTNVNEEKKLNLTKVELKKKGDKINLTKSNSNNLGKIVVNLNWNKGVKKVGLFGFGGSDQRIDLDLGCLYELKSGQKFVVQALGNAFGDYNHAPYIYLLNDDRSGDSADGENIWINGDKISEIKRILIYAFIYEGVANWSQADAVVTVKQPNGPEITVRLDEHRNGLGMCGIVLLENINEDLRIEKLVSYFPGHMELDKAFGWGLKWKEGTKD